MPYTEPVDAQGKIDLLKSSRNYSALIDIYRKRLEEKDNADDRYSLALYYYRSDDCESAIQYISPVATADIKNRLLFVRSLIDCEKYVDAVAQTNNGLQQYPGNYDLLNLRGVAESLSGKTTSGRQSIQSARDLFINDRVAINNLAMVDIIDGNYKAAIRLLLPLYQNGCKELPVLHNLVYALIRSGNLSYARQIIEKENLSSNADVLIESLKFVGGNKSV